MLLVYIYILPETIMRVDHRPLEGLFLYKRVLVSFHDSWREGSQSNAVPKIVLEGATILREVACY